jgi:hypothetical protein
MPLILFKTYDGIFANETQVMEMVEKETLSYTVLRTSRDGKR